MNLDDVQQFAAVARLGSFSQAARARGVARSTITRVVQRLEAELGTTLLHRSTRRVELTNAGAELLERISPALADLDDAVAELRSRGSEPTGLLRVSATSDVGVSILAPVIAELISRHPKLRVETVLTLRPVDLIGEQIDCALRTYAGEPKVGDLLGTRLGLLHFGWFAAPGYLQGRSLPRTEAELWQHALIGTAGSHPRLAVQMDDSLFGLALVKAGAGIGLLPQALCAEDVDRGTLIRVLPEVSVMTGQLWLVYPRGAKSPRLAVFREAVRRQVALGLPLVRTP